MATQLQQTLQRTIMDMLTALQQGHALPDPCVLPNPKEQPQVRSQREEQNPCSVHGQPNRQQSRGGNLANMIDRDLGRDKTSDTHQKGNPLAVEKESRL